MSIAEIVSAWFQEKIATGAIARDTEAYNQAFAAKAELIARLEAAQGGTGAPAPAAEPTQQPETPEE